MKLMLFHQPRMNGAEKLSETKPKPKKENEVNVIPSTKNE